MRIAQQTDGALTFLHSDHLGSTRLTTLGNGTDRYSQEYHAFGAKRGGGLLTSFRFTGQREETGSGLIYMHARYYDPATGQFISPDSIVPEPGRIVAYNRYLYAYADPLSFSDPSGHEPLLPPTDDTRVHECGYTTCARDLNSQLVPVPEDTPYEVYSAGYRNPEEGEGAGVRALVFAGVVGVLLVPGVAVPAAGVAAGVCGDGDCASEMQAATQVLTNPVAQASVNFQVGADRIAHIMAPKHAWGHLIDLGDDQMGNYKTLQPILQQVINTGRSEILPSGSSSGTTMQYVANITGRLGGSETVVVRVYEKSPGVLEITNAWVQTRAP